MSERVDVPSGARRNYYTHIHAPWNTLLLSSEGLVTCGVDDAYFLALRAGAHPWSDERHFYYRLPKQLSSIRGVQHSSTPPRVADGCVRKCAV